MTRNRSCSPGDDDTKAKGQIKRNKIGTNTNPLSDSQPRTGPTKDQSEPNTIEGTLTQQQTELNQTHKTGEHNSTVNPTNDCQQPNTMKRKLEGMQSPCARKRRGERHVKNDTHIPTLTQEANRNVTTRSGTQNTTHIDRTQRAANERKKRQSETMHENPRKRKKQR